MYETTLLTELPAVFTMPYLTFVATVAISVLAGLLAAHIPTRKMLSHTAAEILRG